MTTKISSDFKTVTDERSGVTLPLSPLLAAALDLPDHDGTHDLVRAHVRFMADVKTFREARKAADVAYRAAQEANAEIQRLTEMMRLEVRAAYLADAAELAAVQAKFAEPWERCRQIILAYHEADAADREALKVARDSLALCEAISEAGEARAAGKVS
jgi:hypothetical protein